ncbi:MAG: aspartate/glutamate racemase family protein [bacterium]|nr:aspartate/glutamate racemase family protein [bacterium]
MKTLGLIGGTTWVSTVDYYRLINQMVNQRLGGLNSARMLLYSVNFEEFRPPDTVEGWENVTQRIIAIARTLEQGGAEGLVLCANTLHKIADPVQEKIGIPIIHIAKATAAEIGRAQLHKVALLGTKFTMQEPFYHDKLRAQGIETLIPEQNDRLYIHDAILDEMALEIFKPETKQRFLEIITQLQQRGAQAIVLGCTEIPILIKPADTTTPLFDTTHIHAQAAVDFALSD